jgi:leucyl/phenylalanyl-tRNA--protein transferase
VRPDDPELIRLILSAYQRGVFPMGTADTPVDPAALGLPGAFGPWVQWITVDPRSIIPLQTFHASRSLRAAVRSKKFVITSNNAFARVIQSCANVPRGTIAGDSWINPWIIDAFVTLHAAGHAHSIEAWLPAQSPDASPTLVGGLYGVHLGGAFFGESMFSRPDLGGTNASKVCLVHLVAHLRRRGFALLDTQYSNPHMEQFGVRDVPRGEYLRLLRSAAAHEVGWGELEPLAI